MNIVIEGRALTGNGGGVKTYVSQLLTHLASHQREATLTVIDDSGYASSLGYSTLSVPLHHEVEILLNTWLSFRVQKAISSLAPNLVHYTKAAMPHRSIYPSIVTLYDVIPILLPSSQALMPRLYWPSALSHAAKTSNHILTISETSKTDIVKHLHVLPEKITVTPLAVNHDHFSPQSPDAIEGMKANLGIKGPYILFVATRDLRKNITSLLKAFAAIHKTIPHQLVIAGKTALKDDNSKAIANYEGIGDNVLFLDFVPYEDLPALYSGADLFVWPSIYEGWSLPSLEAMACGTPVIVSNGGALPEVVGKAGEIVPFTTDALVDRSKDTVFIQELARRIQYVLDTPAKRAEMKAAGIEQAKKFSWQAVADRTWNTYQQFAI